MPAGHMRTRSEDRQRSAERRHWRSEQNVPGGHLASSLSQGSYHGFKMAVAVIVFHFAVKMLVQFADILLPFIMALVLVSVLEPIKQVTHSVLECTLLLLFRKVAFCSCCLRLPRKRSTAEIDSRDRAHLDMHDFVKRLCLFVAIVVTLLLAGRLAWLVGRIVWLSGEAVTQDFKYYQSGVQKRGDQIQTLLTRYHLQRSVHFDEDHITGYALRLLRYIAEFLTEHAFYTVSQVCLTTIFVVFLLYSPVQRDFSPVMQGVFESMELYLKLKTAISVTMGITNGIALAVIGIELPAAWGLLTFLANFIPNIGGPLMSVLPCVIAVLDVRKTLYQVMAALMAQGTLHFTIANFVEPVVFGTTEEIHSVVVLLGLSFFGYIWGLTGMFLSVPLLFAGHAWLEVIARTASYPTEARDDARFLMGMLEGRWLADSIEKADDEIEGVNLLTGEIEVKESNLVDAVPSSVRGRSPSPNSGRQGEGSRPPSSVKLGTDQKGPPPVSTWQLTAELQTAFAVRDPHTDDVRIQGLILRWLALGTACFVVFFGVDLAAFIHPTGEEEVQVVSSNNTSQIFSDALSTTSAAATAAGSMATFVTQQALHAVTDAAGVSVTAMSGHTTTTNPNKEDQSANHKEDQSANHKAFVDSASEADQGILS